ncbi:MAG: DUF418 domain-containing protein [Pseudomonadota bacterium]
MVGETDVTAIAAERIDLKSSAPVEQARRYDVLDAVRGFALFGIFLANIRLFSGWEFMSPDQRAEIGGGLVGAYEAFHIAIIDGKFYTLFSLLFGIGFSLQISRLTASGPRGVWIYVRRLTVLLAIGFIHLVMFWVGDILTPYAILGFALLLTHKWSDRTVLVAACISFLSVPVGYLLAMQAGIAMDMGFYALGGGFLAQHIAGFQGDILQLVQSDRWSTFFAFNNGGALIRVGYLLESWRLPKLLFIMLMGIWVGRQIVQRNLLANTGFLKKVAAGGLLMGLPLSLLYAKLGVVTAFAGPASWDGLVKTTVYIFSVFPLGFAYGALFVLAWQYKPAMLRWFSAPGRMALTNYLGQTLIGIALFYGIGFDLAGSMGPVGFLSTALLIYAGQVFLSNVWMARFQFGPMEWLWRSITYGKIFTLRRASASNVSN